MRRRLNPLLVLFALLLTGALVALRHEHRAQAADGQSANPTSTTSGGYYTDQQSVVFRTATSAIDSNTLASALATKTFHLNGKQNLSVSPRFTVSGSTVQVRIVYTWVNPSTQVENFLGCSQVVTLTAGTLQDVNQKWVAPSFVFDGLGANCARITIVASPTNGTVEFWVGSY